MIEASDGAEALEVASAYSERIDLLLTDIIMPKVNGVLMASRLLQERPGLRVLFMSGYVGEHHAPGETSRSNPTSKAFHCRTLFSRQCIKY